MDSNNSNNKSDNIKIVFTASNIAHLINEHQFRDLPNAYRNLLNSSHVAKKTKDSSQELVSKVINDNKINEFDYTAVKDALGDKANDFTYHELKGLVNKSVGQIKEKTVYEILRDKFNIDVKMQQEMRSKDFTITIDGDRKVSFTILGAIDGAHNNKIIEIKNRARKANLNTVYNYEVVQTMIYMNLFDMTEATLIAHFSGAFKFTNIPYSDEKFTDIIQKLTIITDRIINYSGGADNLLDVNLSEIFPDYIPHVKYTSFSDDF